MQYFSRLRQLARCVIIAAALIPVALLSNCVRSPNEQPAQQTSPPAASRAEIAPGEPVPMRPMPVMLPPQPPPFALPMHPLRVAPPPPIPAAQAVQPGVVQPAAPSPN